MSASPILWSVTFRAIYPHQGLVQSRARGVLVLKAETSLRTKIRALTQSVVSAPTGNSIAAYLPRWRDWRTAIERTQTQPALAVRRLLSQGLRLICNGFRLPYKAAGKLIPFSLVHDANQSASVQGVLISPFHSAEPLFLGLVALSDGHRVGERKQSCPDQDGANPHQNRASR